MAAARTAADPISGQQRKVYNEQIKRLKEIRAAYNAAAVASGEWGVATTKVVSATEAMNDRVRKHKITLFEAIRNMDTLKKSYKDYAKLQNASLSQFTTNTRGKNTLDLFIPNELPKSLENARMRYGYINEVIRGISHQTVNWGKNTQWAGRQITVGLSMPMGVVAVAAAAAAYQVDKELTRIAKVYDTTSQNYVAAGQKQAAVDKELAQLRRDSLQNSTLLAKQYGAAVRETLETEADLAATGLQGQTLLKATSETTRIATLGEIDRQDALQMTIALQTAFKMSSQELTDTFNYMNAVENATSLGLDDIAKATPRAASALAGLGVSAKEMTVMMVAMKESGVQAEQGANALKSAATRILNPTKAAIEEFRKHNIDIQGIVQQTQGNVYEYLTTLSAAMQEMTALERQQAIAKLFGTYQFNRLNALLMNLGDAANGVANQTKAAMDTMGQSAEENANLADTEIRRFQESVSGRFKRSFEGMKAELAKLGEPMMEVVTKLVQFGSGILEFVNNMTPATKKIVLWGAAIAGIVGPLMMLIGIMANFAGSIAKAFGALGAVAFRFKMLTTEETAAELAARRAANSFNTQTAAAGNLTLALQGLQAQLIAVSRQQGYLSAGATGSVMGAKGSSQALASGLYHTGNSTRLRDASTGRFANQGQIQAARDAAHAQALKDAQAMQVASQKTALSWKETAGQAGKTALWVGTAAATTGYIASQSESAKDNWFQWAMAAAMFAQVLPVGKIATGFSAAIKAAGGVLGAIKGWMPAILNFGKVALRFLGPVGIIAGGLLLFKQISDKMSEMQRKQEAINKSGEDWAKILGYTYQEGAGYGDGVNPENTIGRQVELVNKLKEENETLYNVLKNARSEQEKMNLAIREGLKVRASGGSPEDARTAVKTALLAAGFTEHEIETEIMLKINAEVDFGSESSILDQAKRQLQGIFNESVADIDAKGWVEKTFGGGGASDAAKAAASEAAQVFLDQFSNINTSTSEGRRMAAELFQELAKNFEAAAGPAFEEMRNAMGPQFATLGIENMQDLIDMLNEGPDAFEGNIEKLNAWNVVTARSGAEIRKYRDLQDIFINKMKEQNKTLGDSETEINNFDDAAKVLGYSFISLEQAQQNYAQAQLAASYAAQAQGRSLSDAEKLVLLNAERYKAGLEPATSLTQGFGGAMRAAAQDAEDMADAVENAAVATRQDLISALEDAMSGSMSSIYSEADRGWDEAVNARVNAIERSGESRIKRMEAAADAKDAEFDKKQEALDAKQKKADKDFEKSWKARLKANDEYWDKRKKNEEAAYDARIKQIEDQIKAEEEADKRREKLFQAERRRIERLANMYNRNIDFNAALASGNLDEAAKIANDASAQEQQWLIDDQSETSGDASEQRKKALNDKKSKIEDEKKTRLDAIKKLEEAEKERLANIKEREQEALKARQEADKKALASERDRIMKSMQAERQAAQEEIRINADAERKKWAEKKRLLDLELATLKAFIPKNEAELKAHVARVDAKYTEFGGTLKWKQSDWGKHLGTMLTSNVQRAAAEIRNKVAWKAVGEDIADEMAAAFDLNSDQLLTWLKTGVFPGSQAAKNKNSGAVYGGGTYFGGRALHVGGVVRHSGGPAWSQKDRIGVPRSAGIYPSEVPTVLKAGEYVVNSKATRKNLGLLESINAGRSPIAKEGRNVTGTLGMARHSGGLISGIGGLVAAGVGKAISQGIASTLSQTIGTMIMQTMGGINPNDLGAGAVDMVLRGLRMQESSNNYKARSRISSASGAYQYIRGTWGNYGGYPEAWMAPPAVQDARARADLMAAYNRYKDWEKAIAHHFYPAWANNKAKWGQAPGKGNPTVWDYVSGVLAKAGLGGGSGALGGGVFGRGGNWPAAQQGRVSPNTAAAVAHVRRNWPQIRSIGTIGNRPNKSDHPMGKAADFMIPSWNSPQGIALGNAIAQWFVNNPGAFGTKYVIWRDQINSGSGWRRYTHPNGPTDNPTLQHRDHVHLSVLHGGGMAGYSLPQLNVGGNIKYDNTVANLHRGETVLTAPLSQRLKDGIDNLDSGGKTVYDIDIDLRGAYIREDVDIERAVWAAIEKREKKNGRNRRVD